MLAICASPRRNGNAAKMLEIAAAQAKKSGYEVTYVDLYQKKIANCMGCMKCKQSGCCIIQDDIVPIREALLEAKLVVVSCPTYFANVTGPMKNVMDRLVAAVMDDNNSPIPKGKLSKSQKYLLMTTCSTPAPFDRIAGQSIGCIKAMREVFHVAGMKSAGTVIFAGTRNKEAIPTKIQKRIEKHIRNS